MILVESVSVPAGSGPEKLKKKTDVLNLEQLENNTALVREILKDGIRIYG